MDKLITENELTMEAFQFANKYCHFDEEKQMYILNENVDDKFKSKYKKLFGDYYEESNKKGLILEF